MCCSKLDKRTIAYKNNKVETAPQKLQFSAGRLYVFVHELLAKLLVILSGGSSATLRKSE